MTNEKYTLVEGGILVKTKLSADIDEPYELFLDATAAQRLELQDRNDAVRRILEILDESNIGNYWRTDGYGNADLEVQIGYEQRGYGVFDMSAEIVRPTVSDNFATLIATQAMRQMAHDLGTYPDKDISSLVYAQVSTTDGITLETYPIGSCSMDTNGDKYNENSEKITLSAHNLYTHDMQLICISGLIALARAR